MTAKKDLKKRVRARQRQTGERYTTALERVKQLGVKKRRVVVVEMPDLTAIATAVGLKCPAYCSFAFWNQSHQDEERASIARSVLERLLEVLRATETDPSTALLRGALLHGKTLPSPRAFAWWQGGQLRPFIARLRLGVRGTSADGQAIAFEAPDPGGGTPAVVVAMLWPSGARPVVYLSLAAEWLDGKPFFERLAAIFGLTLSDLMQDARR